MSDIDQNETSLQDSSKGSIDGISIASFLQMLEQERHSCKVLVNAGNKLGYLYFFYGELIDAEFGQLSGIKAAYAIVSWESPSISLNETEDRDKTIEHPLGFILLNKAGKIVVHSAPNVALGELIIYCIITSSNLRKSLKAKSPRRIQMQMEDGTSLLIIPKAGKILGMILTPNSSAIDVADRIHAAFAIK